MLFGVTPDAGKVVDAPTRERSANRTVHAARGKIVGCLSQRVD
jgi:hypothetical protein